MVLQKYKYQNIIEVGVDEVGRGCLFGRVYAASVILPNQFECDTYTLIKDSKKLSKARRNYLAEYIKSVALDYSIGYVEVDEIDKTNILVASQKAMHKALDKLNIDIDMILVDGDKFKQYMDRHDNYISHECIVNGDNEYLSIAAASILAKTARDNYIQDLVSNNQILSNYGLSRNMGYGTKFHIEAIKKYGITEFHRKTFGICKNFR